MIRYKERVHTSFVIGVIAVFFAAIFDIISFVSPHWIVAKRGKNLGFLRLGLWEACFDNFILPEDYVSKAYSGCWYIYYPEYKYIRFWLIPMACHIVIVITVGVKSRQRQWLPRPDHNRLSWSFAFAVLSGFASVLSLFGFCTHYLAVESRLLLEDPEMRRRLLDNDPYVDGESRIGGPYSVGGFTTSGLRSSTGYGGGTTGLPAGTSALVSSMSRPSMAPGAIGPAAAGTSAANVSAKLRQSLAVQQEALRRRRGQVDDRSMGYEADPNQIGSRVRGEEGAAQQNQPTYQQGTVGSYEVFKDSTV